MATFPATSELDPDALVHVFGEIKDGLALGLVHCWLGPLGTTALEAAPNASRTSSCTPTLDIQLIFKNEDDGWCTNPIGHEDSELVM